MSYTPTSPSYWALNIVPPTQELAAPCQEQYLFPDLTDLHGGASQRFTIDSIARSPAREVRPPLPPKYDLRHPRLQAPLLSSSSADRTRISYTCWDHGCNGRKFSCAENFRRHVRERRGTGTIACPYCLLTFSRKSNRKAHLVGGRCKALKGAPPTASLLNDLDAEQHDPRFPDETLGSSDIMRSPGLGQYSPWQYSGGAIPSAHPTPWNQQRSISQEPYFPMHMR